MLLKNLTVQKMKSEENKKNCAIKETALSNRIKALDGLQNFLSTYKNATYSTRPSNRPASVVVQRTSSVENSSERKEAEVVGAES